MNYLLSHNNKIPSWDKMGFDVFHNEGYWLHRKGSLAPFDVMPDNAHEDEITARLIGIHIQDLNETIAIKDAVILAQSERIKELERELTKYQPRFKVGDTVQNYGRIVEIKEIVDMSNVSFHYSAVEQGSDEWELIAQIYLQPLEESEADNG